MPDYTSDYSARLYISYIAQKMLVSFVLPLKQQVAVALKLGQDHGEDMSFFFFFLLPYHFLGPKSLT